MTIDIDNKKAFKMQIADDGSGFDVQKEMDSVQKNGLKNILSRAKQIDFEANIDSNPSFGTIFWIKKQE